MGMGVISFSETHAHTHPSTHTNIVATAVKLILAWTCRSGSHSNVINERMVDTQRADAIQGQLRDE